MKGTTRVITLPNGKYITLGRYVAAFNALKHAPPETPVDGWDYFPTTAGHIVAEYRRAIDDRVNIRGGLVIRERIPHYRIVRRAREAGVPCECRWCGTAIPFDLYARRFCSQECIASHAG